MESDETSRYTSGEELEFLCELVLGSDYKLLHIKKHCERMPQYELLFILFYLDVHNLAKNMVNNCVNIVNDTILGRVWRVSFTSE